MKKVAVFVGGVAVGVLLMKSLVERAFDELKKDHIVLDLDDAKLVAKATYKPIFAFNELERDKITRTCKMIGDR